MIFKVECGDQCFYVKNILTYRALRAVSGMNPEGVYRIPRKAYPFVGGPASFYDILTNHPTWTQLIYTPGPNDQENLAWFAPVNNKVMTVASVRWDIPAGATIDGVFTTDGVAMLYSAATFPAPLVVDSSVRHVRLTYIVRGDHAVF
jgi:hypothetical protein